MTTHVNVGKFNRLITEDPEIPCFGAKHQICPGVRLVLLKLVISGGCTGIHLME